MYYLVSETKGVTAKQKIIVLHPKMNSLQKKSAFVVIKIHVYVLIWHFDSQSLLLHDAEFDL